jgi:hypothetical protein
MFQLSQLLEVAQGAQPVSEAEFQLFKRAMSEQVVCCETMVNQYTYSGGTLSFSACILKGGARVGVDMPERFTCSSLDCLHLVHVCGG